MRGLERTELAQSIHLNHGGSSYEARLHDKADNDSKKPEEKYQVPYLTTYQKVKSEHKNKDVPTKEWIENLHFVALSYQNKNNYVRRIITFPQLCIQLFVDKALDILHSIPQDNRIALMDSTGRLVKIPKYKASWIKRIINYFFLVKDLRTHSSSKFRSFRLNEMITSEHDTESVSSMLR